MEIKTSELQGAALDWAVFDSEFGTEGFEHTFSFSPSTDWSQGGLIIERERIDLTRFAGQWTARLWAGWRDIEYPQGTAEHAAAYRSRKVSQSIEQQGSTALIAAMRCYVASKFGDKVNVPEEIQNAFKQNKLEA